MESDEKSINIYEPPKWGFHLISEVVNGRLAMIALFTILTIEIITKQSIFKILDLRN
uniref:High light inducible protein n=1 Tax=Dictyopteris divaricata TaxID=156996 RepID=A0A2I4Q2N1_9PHAE|nr:hypothetical protein [Dictyopteris divaricata]YP_010205389.1 hypothetical protein LK366_pgp002 [Grateloupia livida]AQZ25100.1 hypothetical protein [Dictyopteris divaricata]UAV85958.1 hypothetical protein [Grateloupia livida]